MNLFVYVGKHTRGVRLQLPTRTIVVDQGEPFEVTDDEADVLDNIPFYERADTPSKDDD